ncbi:MarR family winged helix-turn-helix transcriptional regulator [Rhizobium sp. SSA_523]|uniref:MarR family winged helix-turn-helix transcriptional regulator n=1 Tax=Rhizobium sp. SSA_523 TaxID=2952477 RepID=UPI002091099E|nr:MarR family transcriptional regulator [Rhizobium sp. SSA_523]MCO5733552.1 MarR family transcriptional regulator [Rhizobium sp. SSA_523]WKC23145.1 MarR family transcriptional regulator [Rhizobium sp. SSA_523]
MATPTELHNLGFLLTDSARLLRSAFERRIGEMGLEITPGEARTLLNIHTLTDAKQLEIAARMGVEPMTVCSFLDRLQTQGLIARHPDPVDRRAKRVTLTAQAEPLIARLKAEIADVLREACAGLADEDVLRLHHILETVSANLQSAGNAGQADPA